MHDSKIDILGYPVYSKGLTTIGIPEEKTIVNTLNAYSYVTAKKDMLFQNALKSSDLLLADGFPVVVAAKMLKKASINKIAGEDIFFHLLHIANQKALKCFFLGSSQKTLDLIRNRLTGEFPNVVSGYYSPPYVPEFSADQSAMMCDAVAVFAPDILFVGMTAPKQEKWVFQQRENLNAKVICSIGAVFDFYAGTVKRPSPFWIKLKLEWFIRLLKEPKRLWKRYLVYSPVFFGDLLIAVLRK